MQGYAVMVASRQMDKHSTIMFLVGVIVPVSSLAGLANLLRSDREITWRAVASVMLNSGLFGLAVASWMLPRLGAEAWGPVIAISVMAGLGGNASLEFGLQLARKLVLDYTERRHGS